jgi:hypothetical protein
MNYDFEYYCGCNITVPTKPAKPFLRGKHTSVEALAYAEALVEYERELLGYQEDKAFYGRELSSRREQFFAVLAKDYNLSIRELALVWEEAQCHASADDIETVYAVFDSLITFIDRYNTQRVKMIDNLQSYNKTC